MFDSGLRARRAQELLLILDEYWKERGGSAPDPRLLCFQDGDSCFKGLPDVHQHDESARVAQTIVAPDHATALPRRPRAVDASTPSTRPRERRRVSTRR